MPTANLTPRDFDGRAVVLTGVGRPGQVGEMVARAFADRGAVLVLVDVDAAETEQRAADLRARNAVATALRCDLTDAAQVDSLAGSIARAHPGGIDAVVHLAGGFAMSGPVDASDVSVWQRQFAINLTTAFLATRALLPLVRRKRGALVYFASAAALPGAVTAQMSAYVAAKSGVLALMRAVAQEERESGVRANAVAPTAIRTSANLAAMGSGIPYVEREEIADAVLFLCSDAARRITGQVVQLG